MIKQQLLHNIIHLPVLYEQKYNDLIHASSVREKAAEGKTRLFIGEGARRGTNVSRLDWTGTSET